MTMYEISFANGDKPAFYTNYEEACGILQELYGDDIVIGHDGDLSTGGDRTLVWENEKDSENDSGKNAIASISFLPV
jgi:hypothetical protein